MANQTSNHTQDSVYGCIRKGIIKQANNPTGRERLVYFYGTKAVTPTSYNTNGDTMELFQFPDGCRLISAWARTDTVLDAHATPTLENDLALNSTAHAVSSTLVESSTAFRTDEGVISWGPGGTVIAGTNPGMDVSNLWLAITTDAAAATAAATATFSFGALCYMGTSYNLGAA